MSKQRIPVEPPRNTGSDIEFIHFTPRAFDVAFNLHMHNAIELLYVTEGTLDVTVDNIECILREGDLILFCSNTAHRGFASDPVSTKYYTVKAPPSIFLNLSKNATGYIMRFAINRKDQKFLWRSDELEGTELKRILEALIRENTDRAFASDVAININVLNLLLALLRYDEGASSSLANPASSIIYEVMRYVQSNFSEDIDEKKLASDFGMSYSYFSRTFKAVTGETFKCYLNRIRINNAEQLLCSSNKTISEIATFCGYNSISYFISVYRSIKKTTPCKAQRALRDN